MMRIQGTHYRSIWPAEDGGIEIIDQTALPFSVTTRRLETLDDAVEAIRAMRVRGAPLIGATAAYGLCLALRDDASDRAIAEAAARLAATRPTAVNLAWALAEMRARLLGLPEEERPQAAYQRAAQICDADVEINRAIGRHGLAILRERAAAKPAGEPVRILTHCNAGWLATVDWGTATAPIYMAHDEGIALHVWADETRPRNQGALTAFELGEHGVPHSLVADNAGGHLMQRGLVDLCIVGTDRTTPAGDVANKIGTYLKALAARDNGVPFYVALPSPTIDWDVGDAFCDIPIEERDAEEVTHVSGQDGEGAMTRVRIAPDGTNAVNYAFDVTPARLVTGLITERGVSPASREGLAALFPEHARGARDRP